MSTFSKLLPIAALVVIAGAAPVRAQTFGSVATQTMQVSATVTGTCTLTAPNLNFVTLKGTETGSISTTGNFSVACPQGSNVAFAIGIGTGNTGSGGGRVLAMSGGTGTQIPYKLICPGSGNCATSWGNTSNDWYSGGTGGSAATSVQVTAQIPTLPSGLTPGVYTDSVVATLNY